MAEWDANKVDGEDAGDPAGALSTIAGVTVDVKKGYKIQVMDILAISGEPVGNHDVVLQLIDTDDATVLETYYVGRFWADGYIPDKPKALEFMGGTASDDDTAHRSVAMRTVETSGTQVARKGSFTFAMKKA